jgi:hypothetical protein
MAANCCRSRVALLSCEPARNVYCDVDGCPLAGLDPKGHDDCERQKPRPEPGPVLPRNGRSSDEDYRRRAFLRGQDVAAGPRCDVGWFPIRLPARRGHPGGRALGVYAARQEPAEERVELMAATGLKINVDGSAER